MFLNEFFRSFKFTFEIYNFLHLSQLDYLKSAYKKYGIKRPIFKSINAAYLAKNGNALSEKPWLDELNAEDKLNKSIEFQSFNHEIQQQIRNFATKGFAILPNYFTEAEVAEINSEVTRLVADQKLNFRYGGKKLMFANKYSDIIKAATQSPALLQILNFILGKKVIPFQTINFIKGSEQKPHSDTVHMATYPLGYLAAAWVALEDIDENAGPLVYYPGSHKLPYLMGNGYESGSTKFTIGENAYSNYEAKIESIIKANNLQPQSFLAKMGDVFIWHANLLHGGTKMNDQRLTRKSMVVHYYCEEVICYHEITQRPALLEL